MDSLLNDIDIDSLVPLGAEDALLALDEEDVRLLDDCHKHDGLLLDLDLGVAEAYLPSPESDMTRVVGGSADVGHVEGVQASQVTPATSESYYGHNGNHSNSASGPMGAPGSCEEEERRQLRMKKNRENAYLSRIRKKQQVENLESACRSLAKQNAELNVFVQRLAAENFLLRDHLKEVCGRARVQVPDVPNVLEEVSRGADAEDGGCGDVGNRPWVVVDMAADKGADTAGMAGMADTAGMAGMEGMEGPRAARATVKRKRGGVSSGATAVFLALFSLFLFASPSAFVGDGGDKQSGSALAGLPDVSAVATGLVRSGRGLMEIEMEENQIQGFPEISVSDYFSQTVDALLEDQADLELPKLALSVVEDMAQSALALDLDQMPHGIEDGKEKKDDDDVEASRDNTAKHLLPASTVFPALADRFFSSSGLEAPQMCRKVFEFRAEDVPAVSPSNKKSIEKYVLGTAVGFRGRASGLKVEEQALKAAKAVDYRPKARGNESRQDRGEEPGVDGERTDHNENRPAVKEPSLVSVLLPANASTNPSGPGLTAIDELYVVILNPQNTFSTYACQLPNKRALVV